MVRDLIAPDATLCHPAVEGGRHPAHPPITDMLPNPARFADCGTRAEDFFRLPSVGVPEKPCLASTCRRHWSCIVVAGAPCRPRTDGVFGACYVDVSIEYQQSLRLHPIAVTARPIADGIDRAERSAVGALCSVRPAKSVIAILGIYRQFINGHLIELSIDE